MLRAGSPVRRYVTYLAVLLGVATLLMITMHVSVQGLGRPGPKGPTVRLHSISVEDGSQEEDGEDGRKEDREEDREVDSFTWRNLTRKQVSELSQLGRMMFIDEVINNSPSSQPEETQPTSYKILVWEYGKALENRFFRHYGKISYDPFASCSVRNCRLTYNASDASSADAIMFHLHRTRGVASLPAARDPGSRWVFLSDESPYNTFVNRGKENEPANYDGVFNWSMTFRMDSDVPVPYGRTLLLSEAEKLAAHVERGADYGRNKTKLVAIMGSNCGGANRRWDYVRELQKHVHVDAYGRCGNLSCPGHYNKPCPLLKAYKFYLAFENSNCREYVTEKAWYNAYHHGAVPVIMGASREDCAKLLPPRSYVHTDDFATPQLLADHLLAMDRDGAAYNRYFAWRTEFKVVNEHGYFQTPVYHYCRLCEALNYNSPEGKVYKSFAGFRNVKSDCRGPGWKPT